MRALLCSLVGHRPAPRQYQLTAGATARTWECCPRCREHHRPDVQAALLVRIVAEGQLIPVGYGVAMVDWRTRDALCMPVPLNLVAASARRAWYWMKAPHALVVDTPPSASMVLEVRRERQTRSALRRLCGHLRIDTECPVAVHYLGRTLSALAIQINAERVANVWIS